MDWDLPLFFHILGAMGMLGGLLLAATALANGAASVRLGYRALLWVTLPSWLVMRVAAQITLDESPFDEDDAWITIGFITSEIGLLPLVAATVSAGLSARRDNRPGLTRAAFVLSVLMIVVYVITIWAMSDKPS